MRRALLVAAWLLCGALAGGMLIADFWHSFPLLQGDPRRPRQLYARAVPLMAGGPITLVAAFIATDCAYHGVMWRVPSPRTSR